MHLRYVPLEEAHPPFKRATDSPIGSAMVRAMSAAAARGRLRIPVPDLVRAEILARKKRHSFTDK